MIVYIANQFHTELATRLRESVGDVVAGKKKGLTDKEVRHAVVDLIKSAPPAAHNLPAGNQDRTLSSHRYQKKSAAQIITQLSKDFSRQARVAGSITLALVGESHSHDPDLARSLGVLAAMTPGGGLDSTDLVIVERDGMRHRLPPGNVLNPTRVSEISLTGNLQTNLAQALSPRQRSTVIAAYLLLSLAGGNQGTADRAVVFAGEEHEDIGEEFDYLAKHHKVHNLDWVARRPCAFYLFTGLS
jgi:hypothetical protein